MITGFRNFFRHIAAYLKYQTKLRDKLFVSFLVLITVTLLVYSNISYVGTSSKLKQYSEDTATQLLTQTAQYLENSSNLIAYVSEQVYFNSNLKSLIEDNMGNQITPDSFGRFTSIRSILKQTFISNKATRLTLYVKNWPSYFEINAAPDSISFSDYNALSSEPWFEQLETSNGKLIWIPSSKDTRSGSSGDEIISAVRLINSESDYSDHIGALRIDLRTESYQEIINKMCLDENCFSYLFNTDGISMMTGDSHLDCGIPIECLKNAVDRPTWTTEIQNRTKVLLGTIRIPSQDWILVAVIPYDTFLRSSVSIRNETLVLAAVIFVISFLAAYFLSNTITSRISLLANQISKAPSDCKRLEIDDHGTDEVSELTRSYNFLLDRIQEYSKIQFESGKAVKQAELRALQAQINPHFLYNILELVNWLAMSKGVPEISDIAISLSKYYKLSLNKGKDFISVGDELSHIRLYVKLQNYRFQDTVHLEINVSEELYSYMIPNLILQPIVENAVLHGIAETDNRSGKVIISAEKINEKLVIKVSDDGTGMSPEQVHALVFDSHSEFGYGLYNVNQRIKLIYGEEYGITVNSVLGEGTTVTILLAVTD